MKILEVNLHPTVCNLCGGDVIFTSNQMIYGREYGSGKCYLCTACGAYVGTHIPRPEEAFGILANKEMREYKKRCHALFDALWLGEKSLQEKRHKRKELYRLLAEKLDISVNCCHFGYFDLELLQKALCILHAGSCDRGFADYQKQ